MGLTTVIRDYGTEILNAIRENDLQKLRMILERQLRSDMKIAKLCVTDIKHKPSKKFACPLILAARQEDSRIIKYMMDKGVDPNFVHHTIFSSKRREIVTALHISVDLGFSNTVEALLGANADANIYDHNQETPLHIAVKKADRVMTRLLLSRGADAAIPDRRGNAALHIATLYGHLELVRTLLKYDADVYQKGQWNTIPPHIAAKEGHIHLIQLFCSRDVGNINIKIPCFADKREKTPVHLAAEHGHVETVLALLDQFEADVNMKDSDGNTALHCVVLHPYDPHRMRDKEYFTETARVLIKYRVTINEKNIFGDTALHFAAMNHFQRIVELLLEVGANPFIENDEGLKPIDVVPDSDPVTKQYLKRAMLNPKPPVNQSSDSMQPSALGHGFKDSRSKSNMSFKSTSSMASVFVDDVPGNRPMGAQRPRDSRRFHSEGGHLNSHDDQPLEQDQDSSVYQKIENEIPVYTKVDKDKKQQKKGGRVEAIVTATMISRQEAEDDDDYDDDDDWDDMTTNTTRDDISTRSSVSSHHEAVAPYKDQLRRQLNPVKEPGPRGRISSTDKVTKKNQQNKQRSMPITAREMYEHEHGDDDISLDSFIEAPEERKSKARTSSPKKKKVPTATLR